MHAVDFPDHLAASFALADTGAAPLLGLATAGGDLCENLAEVPADAKYLAVRGKARGLELLNRLSSLEAVWASGITPMLINGLAALPRLRALNLYQVGRTDLTPVGRLATLEHLLIGWANHLTDLSWLSELPRLRTLVIGDAKRLNLATLPTLPMLEALELGGGMWTTLKLESLEPLSRLSALKYLALSSISVEDGSLANLLAALPALQTFSAPNIFDVDESGRAAGLRPDLEASVLSPIFAEARSDVDGKPCFPCRSCAAPMLMLTGRRAPLRCPRCDALRIEKHVARWELARAAAALGR